MKVDTVTDNNDHPLHNPVSDKINSSSSPLPKPIFMRLLLLFSGAVGCLFVGVVTGVAISDGLTLVLSIILSVTFAGKGIMLIRKLRNCQVYHATGVCISNTPKIMGRYRQVKLVDIITGREVAFILPRKIMFKIGHHYICYFDHPLSRPNGVSTSSLERAMDGGFFYVTFDLPTPGFLGFEDLGLYQEKVITTKEELP